LGKYLEKKLSLIKKIPAGYKQTEIGVIPEDWDVKKLGDIGDSIIGLTYSPSDVSYFGKLVHRSSNIQNNRLSYDDNVYVDKTINKKLILKDKDILICVRNGSRDLIGKSALIKGKSVGETFGAFMSVFRTDRCQLFIYYLILSNLIQRQIGQSLGATINQITNKTLNNFKIPYPPKSEEQNAIATVLSDTDALIECLGKLIAKKKAIKQGAMQQLLTGKKRLPGFNGEWEMKKLEKIGEIITGSTPPTQIKEYWNGSIPWITPTDISDKKDIYNSEREISPLGLQVIRKLPANALLVTCIASIGKNAILRVNGACNQQINAIIPNENSDVDFLYYLIENNKQYLLGNAGITATLIISKKYFSEIVFSFPKDKSEQTAIATILSDMDAEIESLEQKRDKYIMLKQGMMQQLLTGRIRIYANN